MLSHLNLRAVLATDAAHRHPFGDYLAGAHGRYCGGSSRYPRAGGGEDEPAGDCRGRSGAACGKT
jgi:hypothetical protein